MELPRARRETPHTLVINDPQPVSSISDIWGSASQLALIGIFILLLGAMLYVARPILLPILAALLIAMTLAPIVKEADRRHISPWLAATLIVAVLVAAAATLVTLLAAPMIAWIDRAPEIAARVKEKLYVLDYPLAALRDLQNTLMPPSPNSVKVEPSQITLVAPVIAALTPAVAQVAIFAATLFFALIGQVDVRRHLALMFASREGKLRFLRIANDIEYNLASYVAVVTAINFTLGAVVAAGAWAFGFENPLVLGLLTAILNYIPYIGPACMVIILFGVGLVTFPSFGQALLPPVSFVALTTIEGHILTPMILGHRLTLNPLVIFVAIVFWAWLWGPIGAFLAVPLSIVGLVAAQHLLPSDEPKLPG
ncbi:MAG: AI-2E family transporter [Xanthobacteraceae bacterium]|nr:AI-2E family transporter [Xanthobacteraceae bacterium]